MPSTMSILPLLSLFLLPSVFGGADPDPQAFSGGWHFDAVYTLGNEMLDPIVSPNGQSSHMHKILGGSAFKAGYSYDDYNKAGCSSVYTQADKSNYWMPTLYWWDKVAGTFTGIPASTRFYYFVQPNAPTDPVQPFPKGLRIVVGNPNNKDPSIMNYAQFDCQSLAPGTINRVLGPDFNFDMDCPAGMRTELFFPSCWDGVNLYKADGSHMSYTSTGNVRFGACPLSHPVRVPHILLEYTWNTYVIRPGQKLKGNLVWANGDTTGYGMHGDFVNGWDMDVLAEAITSPECGIGTGNALPMVECPVFMRSYDNDKAKTCKPALGLLTHTDDSNKDQVPLKALPGCNSPWGTGAKPACTNNAVLDVSAFKSANGPLVAATADQKPFVLPTTPGWKNISCTSAVPITGGPSYVDGNLTPESCQSSCSRMGYKYATTGMRGSTWNCYCGDTLDMTVGNTPGMCYVPCPGKTSDTCGGPYYYKTWYAASGGNDIGGGVLLADGSKKLGCYNNPNDKPSGLLGAATYSFSSPLMTTNVCLDACTGKNATWGLLTAGMWCYCGTETRFGPGAIVPDSYCTLPCKGNASETCGDSYRSEVYDITLRKPGAGSTTPRDKGYKGCYQEGSGKLALSANRWSLTDLTPAKCVEGCAELGYEYAGLQRGSMCMCDHVFNGGQPLPESQCDAKCNGNSSATCGSTNGFALDLYDTTTGTTTTPATVAAKKPTGYGGCFTDAGTTVALNNYTYMSGTMTVETCVQACAGFGYAFAGLKSGSSCKCGSAFPTTAQLPISPYCASTCPGKSTETCGGSMALEVYNTSTPGGVLGSSPLGANYLGCYTDTTPALNSATFFASDMTIDTCRTGCAELGYALSGVRNGQTCFCGNTWPSTAGQNLPDSSCSVKCPGNATQSCGGYAITSVWKTTGSAPVAPQAKGWVGCYTDSNTGRTLGAWNYAANPMSSDVCMAACKSQGFAYAGTENGNQCWCANTIASTALRTPQTQCATLCSGSTTESCGGFNTIDIYNATSAVSASNGVPGYRGCFSDEATLNGFTIISDWMSADICNRHCYARGFAYGGVRNKNQCKCGATAPTRSVSETNCKNACTADAKQDCGTATGIAVYAIASTGITSGDFKLTPGAKGYAGCFTDSSVNKLLSLQAAFSNSLTVTNCIQNCQSLNYDYAGLQNGNTCFCGAKPNATSGNYQVTDATCATVACSGGGGGSCGSQGRTALYDVDKSGVTGTNLPVGAKGCFAPGSMVGGAGFSYFGSAMTPSICRRACKMYGYSLTGLVNGNKCLCSSTVLYAGPFGPSMCNAPCTGDSAQTCGGGYNSAITIYDSAGSAPTSGFPAGYVGCFPEAAGRALATSGGGSMAMTSDVCKATCKGKGLRWAGVEAGKECWCGSGIPQTGLMDDALCSAPCSGAPNEMCGGASKLSVYDTSLSAGSSGSQQQGVGAQGFGSSADGSGFGSGSNDTSAAPTVPVTYGISAPSSASSAVVVVPTAPSTALSLAASTSRASSAAASASTSTGLLDSLLGVLFAGGSSSTALSSNTASSSAVSATLPTVSSWGPPASSASAASSGPAVSFAPTASATSTPTTSSSVSAAVPSSTITDPLYLGCFQLPSFVASSPAIAAPSSTPFTNATMTCNYLLTGTCQKWCELNGFAYAGATKGDTCGCASGVAPELTAVDDAKCDAKCAGGKGACGGKSGQFVSVWKTTAGATIGPIIQRSEEEGGGGSGGGDAMHAERARRHAARLRRSRRH